jgi:hypothetical protein
MFGSAISRCFFAKRLKLASASSLTARNDLSAPVSSASMTACSSSRKFMVACGPTRTCRVRSPNCASSGRSGMNGGVVGAGGSAPAAALPCNPTSDAPARTTTTFVSDRHSHRLDAKTVVSTPRRYTAPVGAVASSSLPTTVADTSAPWASSSRAGPAATTSLPATCTARRASGIGRMNGGGTRRR